MADLRHKCRPLCDSGGSPPTPAKFHSNANRLRYGGSDEGIYDGEIR